MPGVQTRQTGWACRVYKNADDKVIAIDDIAVISDTRRISQTRFHHSSRWTSKRTLFHLTTGSRVVSRILFFGDFTSNTVDSGDYLNATWDGASENENDATMNFDSLAKVGDTL